MDQLEKRNKRLTVALTMTVVAMCAVVTTAPFLISCNSTLPLEPCKGHEN
ncbi:MAG: hypothetical protein ACKVJG_23200 [Candidatus Latescibacterota bacterium]